MRKITRMLVAALVVSPLLYATAAVSADDDKRQTFKTRLHGFNEPPAVSSSGSGELWVKIGHDGVSFEYELSFQDLEGDVTQAHIHVGQRGVNGGVSVWLCGTTAIPGPMGTPGCGGPRSGGASRVVTAAEVIGPAGQGIAAGEFEELLDAMRAGVTYANVHSARNPGGEIRGQVGGRRDD